MAIRSFVAIEMPEPVQDGLRAAIADLRPTLDGLPVRWIPVENIHLTLKFLGDISEEKVAPILEALNAQTRNASPFDIALDGIGVFPNAHKPNVLWIGLEASDHLNELQRLVETALNPLGYPREARRFSPHLTLARVRRDANFTELRSVGHLTTQARISGRAGGTIESVTLFRSELKPSGSVYNALAHIPLAGKA